MQEFTGHKQEVCGLKWSFDGKISSHDNLTLIHFLQALI